VHPRSKRIVRFVRSRRKEVDTNPPAGAGFEVRYLDFPFPQAVVAHDPPSLFAGKLHALLCRRDLKGRDFFLSQAAKLP
jgi:hypothetical protein